MSTYALDGPISETPSVPVDRRRINDYVGPAIWGFRIPPTMQVGDRGHYYDSVVDYTSHYILTVIGGRRAMVWADPSRDGTFRFAGYVN